MTVIGRTTSRPRLRATGSRRRLWPPWWSVGWAAAGRVLWASGCSVAGGGGSTQTVPDSVRAGEPVAVELHLSVWGPDARIAGQYSGVALFHRLAGTTEFQGASAPRRIPVDERHETYLFTMPPYPAGTTGSIELYFTVTLTGQTTQIPGMKRIRIE